MRGPRPACARAGIRILFLAAIVASARGDGGQGRVRCSNTDASRSLTFSFLSFHLLYRVFLPFLIFGKTFRTRSMSLSVQGRTFIPPTWTTDGEGTFFAAM